MPLVDFSLGGRATVCEVRLWEQRNRGNQRFCCEGGKQMNRKYVVYQGRRENESGGVSLGGKKVRGGGECFSPAGGDHRSASTALLPLTFIRRWSIAAKASPSSFPSTLELRSKEKCSDPLPHAGVVVRVGGAFRDFDPGLTLWPVVTSVCPPPPSAYRATRRRNFKSASD